MSRVSTVLALFFSSALMACGGGGGEQIITGFDYVLSIDGPETQSSADSAFSTYLDAQGRWFLEGDGFLPPGTTCAQTTCLDSMGFISSAYIGLHELLWENLTTGESGVISRGSNFESHLSWACYCPTPPRWSTYVPVVPGLNHIRVTQIAGGLTQQDDVFVARE